MSKKQLSINDIGDSGYKILSALSKWMMVSDIANETRLSKTTVRRVIQRLETFGLVYDELQYSEDNQNVQSKHFNITKEGRAFLKRSNNNLPKSEQQKTIVAASVMNPVVLQNVIDDITYDAPSIVAQPSPGSIVKWLRQKAQEFNAMADDLSVYEE
jgi:DNA-binding MarR family transcriptional regulator